MPLDYNTRVEDYHSDDGEAQMYSPSYRVNANDYENRRRRPSHPIDLQEEEEELERSMYEMDLNAYRHPPPRPRQYDPYLAPSYSPRRRPPPPLPPSYYLAPMPHERYRPWMHPMEERSPLYSPINRSPSSRSHMQRRNLPIPRRRYHEVYHDNEDEEEDYSDSEDDYPPRVPYGFPEANYAHDVSPARSYASRQSSIGSGQNLPLNKRRSNSFSIPPGMPRFVYPASPNVRRRPFQSAPNSPQASDGSNNSSSSSTDEEEEERHYIPRRRLSLGSNMPPPFVHPHHPPPRPPPQLRGNRRFSFSGVPPPPPPPNLPPVVLPTPSMMDNVNPSLPRRNSGFANDFFPNQNPPMPPPPPPPPPPQLAAAVAAAAVNGGAPPMNDPTTAAMPMPTANNPGNEMPSANQPGGAPWLNGAGNTNGLFHPMPMMGLAPMFNHPMMPPPPMWNMMNPTQQQQDPMWLGDFPFLNNQDPNLMTQTEVNRKSPVNPIETELPPTEEAQPNIAPAPEMMPPPTMIPPPQPPMLQRGLSMLGGLFSGSSYRRQPEFSNRGDDLYPPPPQLMNSKKEAKLAKEYAKLGTFYCWRKLDGTDAHFESFSIPNQKIIKRKLAKNAPSQIMLGKEKKLPGEIMVDLQQNRGCYLGKINGEQFLVQLEIKEETYHPANANSFVFATGENSW
ncbi:hypothetical protein A0J61_01201 [Choanephora cucurbitarum]|uniref:Uncharacterized protein n=1 Tax=Choanephora cucurbitarum TaxID=101091 RepID=A0A1C7NNN6_9FUNG|nr:hypothetical protein A0J61_01201 [Choanephora cucurbitarum]